jgi:hypothetical protein
MISVERVPSTIYLSSGSIQCTPGDDSIVQSVKRAIPIQPTIVLAVSPPNAKVSDRSAPWSRVLERLEWNPKINYPVLKDPPTIPILSQMNPIHTLQFYFPVMHF